MVGSKLHTISRISPDGIYYGMETDITTCFVDEFLLYQLHISQDNSGQRWWKSESFCGIFIKHHMPGYWYDIIASTASNSSSSG